MERNKKYEKMSVGEKRNGTGIRKGVLKGAPKQDF